MRHCKHCDQHKPNDEFYASQPRRCKKCVKEKVRAHRSQNLDSIREYDRQRAKTPKRKAHMANNLKRWRSENPDRVNKDRRDHPEKYKARSKVGNALRDGKLIKLPCEGCGETEKVQAHHDDYSKPLDVRWVCTKCHSKTHEPDWINRRK
jgi:ribosomal protein S27AE